MAKKTISNTFTVNTIIDGESAPYYFQEWFAWSNDASTSNVTTPPTIGGSWATSIPAQGSYAYLWRKSIRYVWNENTRRYSAETAQYFRMSGTNGTSINTKGTIKVAITASGTFPTAGFSSGDLGIKQGDSYIWKFNGSSWSHVSSTSSNGDSYTMINDCTIDLDGDGTSENIKGHLIQWSTEASKWIDLGQFKGESGVTYYTHIAWATKVNYNSSGEVTSVEGFTPDKSPNDTTHLWMGVLVDENSGHDSTKATTYTWSYTKGVQGDPAVRYELVPSVNVITLGEDEVPTFDKVFFSLYKTVGSNNPTIYSTVQKWQNGLFKLYYVVDGVQTEVGYDYMLSYDTKVNYHDIEYLYETNHEVTWVVKKNNIVIAQLSIGVVNNGETGPRGKVGRFFYFGGTFNPQDNDPTHVFAVNNAQAPYFEHTENGQKRYHVFNYDTNGSYTMAQMWTINSNWNKPWEAMTNDFKYIITEALFGAYAHLGSFIINGDWIISQHGTINGQENINYTEFDPDHPNDNTGTNFIPYFAVDGLTGKSYQNDAYVNGTIISEGSANSRWEISPELYGTYAIPRIIGYSTGGEKRMQLIFDADDSDTVQVEYGGGLSFVEQEAGVGDVTAAGYFKTTWINSNSDNYNSSYIRATSDPSEPRIEFQSTVNSGKYLKVGVDTSGVLLYSTNWPSYSSNFSDGRVYIDANGYLKVKGQRQSSLLRATSNMQLDGNYDTIVAATTEITITLPSSPVNGQKFTIIPKSSCYLSIGNTSDRIIHPNGSQLQSINISGPNAHYLVYDAVDKYWYLNWCN